MRTRAIAQRIINQLHHDKRTLALMMMAPLLILTLIYFVLEGTTSTFHVAVINAPEAYVEQLYEKNIMATRMEEHVAIKALEQGDIIAIVTMESGKAIIEIDGSNAANARVVLAALETSKSGLASAGVRQDLKSEIHYAYGYEDLSMFDNFGSIFIGFVIFFFVFLVAGISFLQERTTGTLEKLLSTPIKRWEIVAGYILGFGFITLFQSTIISLYVVYVLDVMMVGSFFLVLLIAFLTAICALTLGILISTAANSEFQMIQFIPIVIIPQLFFCGLFQLSPVWEMVGKVMPLYYVADALGETMIRGGGLAEIRFDLMMMVAYSVLFVVINIQLLKKYRRI